MQRTVGQAHFRPARRLTVRRVALGEHLVEGDAMSRHVARPDGAIPAVGSPREQLMESFGFGVDLLNSEVWRGKVEVRRDRHADGRYIQRPVPCGLDAVQLGKGGNLPSVGQATDVADVAADIVDLPILNGVHPLCRMGEDLSPRNRRRALLADARQPAGLFRRKGILHEEQIQRLQRLCQLDRISRVKPLVRIREQLDLIPEFTPQRFEQPDDALAVAAGIIGAAVVFKADVSGASRSVIAGVRGAVGVPSGFHMTLRR